MVNVESNTASGASADITYIDATVDGTTFTIAYHVQDDEHYTARTKCAGNFIVPDGHTYSVNISGNTINTLHELRHAHV